MNGKKLQVMMVLAILAVAVGALAIEHAINRQTDKCMLGEDR